MTDQLVNRLQAAAILNIPEATLRSRQKNGNFPRPDDMSDRKSHWYESTIRRYQQTMDLRPPRATTASHDSRTEQQAMEHARRVRLALALWR